jgi:two-component system sensor histidine kinase BaeS
MTAGDDHERLAIAVHEVRSPVAALAAIAEALSRRPVDREERRELVGLAMAACRGIQRIVADAAVASVRLEAVDAGLLAAEAATAARLGGRSVRAEIDPDLPAVDADPERLRQALDNLLENAVAHSPEGAEVVVRARASGGMVTLAVTDTGHGVPVEEQTRIFEPGVRLARDRVGAGLGLAITRAIAEAHGGRLTVDSAPGEGATFSLALPARV